MGYMGPITDMVMTQGFPFELTILILNMVGGWLVTYITLVTYIILLAHITLITLITCITNITYQGSV